MSVKDASIGIGRPLEFNLPFPGLSRSSRRARINWMRVEGVMSERGAVLIV